MIIAMRQKSAGGARYFCERRGLLKLDILGIKMLDIFKYARKLIKKRHGVTIDIREMEDKLGDRKVLKKFSRGETHGVFQYNSDLQSSYMRDLGNVVFEDLIKAGVEINVSTENNTYSIIPVKDPETDKTVIGITNIKND